MWWANIKWFCIKREPGLKTGGKIKIYSTSKLDKINKMFTLKIRTTRILEAVQHRWHQLSKYSQLHNKVDWKKLFVYKYYDWHWLVDERKNWQKKGRMVAFQILLKKFLLTNFDLNDLQNIFNKFSSYNLKTKNIYFPI